jgi:hypothetical protein
MSQLSLGETTLHSWLKEFCPSDGLANQSAQQENERQQKMNDGCLTLLQTEFPFFAPECSSQRMSKDSFPQGCQMDQASSGIASRDWKVYITKLRQAYSARVKLAQSTKGSEFLSSGWPTPQADDGDNVTRASGVYRSLTREVHGQAAPANPSTDGSRQESWATPNAFCYQPPENTEQWTKRAEYQQTEKGVNLHKPIQTQVLHEVEKQWRTPSSSDGEGGVMEMREGCAGKYKLRDHVVAEQKSWATPRAGKTTDENPETWAARQAKGDVATMPLTAQVKAWATPRVGGEEKAETRIARGKDIGLHGQVGAMNNTAKLNPRWVETLQGVCMGWTSPSCPASVIKNWPKFVSGWCAVTIEQTNYDPAEMELFQQQQNERSES